MVSGQDPFCWDGASAPVVGGESPVEVVAPPRRRGGFIGAALVALAGAGVGVALLAGGGSPRVTGVTELALAHAAALTEHTAGFKTSFSIDATVGAQSVALTGSGWFNERPLDGSMTMSVGAEQINELLLPPYIYLQTPSDDGQWQQIDINGLGLAESAAPQPTDELNALKKVGSVTVVGSQSLGGVATTEYRAVIDVANYSTFLPASTRSAWVKSAESVGVNTIPVDAWVDDAGRVRQLAVDLTLNTAQGSAALSVSAQYYDFGSQPAVSAPPADDVTNAPAPTTS